MILKLFADYATRRAPRQGSMALLLFLAGILTGSCNDHPLTAFEHVVKVQQFDEVELPARPKLDLLWMIDNSVSMCEEQANLTRNFGEMAARLQLLDADINMAVITTDVDDPRQMGRFQNTPATENHLSCQQPCIEDGHCGGTCLCGVPHIQRCQTDAECPEGDKCLGNPGSSILHCARPCGVAGLPSDPTSDKCGATVREKQIFGCTDTGSGNYCLLVPCSSNADCNQGEKQACLPAADGQSYCRIFRGSAAPCNPAIVGGCPLGLSCVEQPDGRNLCEPYGQCPPATCDCPGELPKVLNSNETPNLERDFRCLATVGTLGSQYEKGLESIKKALSPQMTGDYGPDNKVADAVNRDFLRDDAFLAIIILSDENDCSDGAPGQECDPEAPDCQICLDNNICLSGIDTDCVQDPIDSTHYCRLALERDANNCEYQRQFLSDVDAIAQEVRDRKDNRAAERRSTGRRCESDADCGEGEGAVEVCSKSGICIQDRVVVGAIVGPKRWECVGGCPGPNGDPATARFECEEDTSCARPCDIETGNVDAFCADRVSNQRIFNGQSNEPQPSCSSVNGLAYSGRRYIDFVNNFGDQGIKESICADSDPRSLGEFTRALDAITERIAVVLKTEFCINRPLIGCTRDGDCQAGFSCIQPPEPPLGAENVEVAFDSYCGDGNGLPHAVGVLIFEAPEEGLDGTLGPLRADLTPRYTFNPGAGPYKYGCYSFEQGYGPGPGETVVFSYRAGLRSPD